MAYDRYGMGGNSYHTYMESGVSLPAAPYYGNLPESSNGHAQSDDGIYASFMSSMSSATAPAYTIQNGFIASLPPQGAQFQSSGSQSNEALTSSVAVKSSTESMPKKRKPRTIFDGKQIKSLEEFFENDKKPTPDLIAKKAEELSITVDAVQNWYKNRKAKVSRTVASDNGRQLQGHGSGMPGGNYHNSIGLVFGGSDPLENKEMSEEFLEASYCGPTGRTVIRSKQKKCLEALFLYNSKPTADDMTKIAEILHLNKSAVEIWFKNQRSKVRKVNSGVAAEPSCMPGNTTINSAAQPSAAGHFNQYGASNQANAPPYAGSEGNQMWYTNQYPVVGSAYYHNGSNIAL